MRSRSISAALSALLVFLTACNVPLSAQPLPTPNLPATITAQAGVLQGAPSATQPALPVTGVRATPALPQVRVTSPTNCRTGPSTAYGLVFVANPNADFRVVGRYTPGNYWIIENPAGGTCWLWGQFAVPGGNVASVPEITVPSAPVNPTETAVPTGVGTMAATETPNAAPTAGATPGMTPTTMPQATPVPPNAPTNLQQSRTCTSGTRGTTAIWFEDITLTWRDTTSESGYRIYQNGNAITSLAQNSTSYQFELRYDQGAAGPSADNFGVDAYNNGGESLRLTIDVPRCP